MNDIFALRDAARKADLRNRQERPDPAPVAPSLDAALIAATIAATERWYRSRLR